MDFARKQLEKYGWSDGKGLGKHENGIAEALKPKLKRSVAGVGHDLASEFTEHWWSALYDKAASNVEIQEKNGKTKKIKTKVNSFEITNSTWRLKRKEKASKEEEYADYFVKKAVLSNEGLKMEKGNDSESEEIEHDKRDVFKMTDDELFAACEGRTAHKGARHGLKATGKLARIERQEQMLLIQPKYNGYSFIKENNKEKLLSQDQKDENINLKQNSTIYKKKKRKHCLGKEIEIENSTDVGSIEMAESSVPSPKKKENGEASTEKIKTTKGKSKKKKNKVEIETVEENGVKKSKKIHKYNYEEIIDTESITSELSKKKRNQRAGKTRCLDFGI